MHVLVAMPYNIRKPASESNDGVSDIVSSQHVTGSHGRIFSVYIFQMLSSFSLLSFHSLSLYVFCFFFS